MTSGKHENKAFSSKIIKTLQEINIPTYIHNDDLLVTVATIIALAIIFLVVWGCFWCVDRSGLPYPASMIGKVIIAIIGIVALLVKAGLISSAALL